MFLPPEETFPTVLSMMCKLNSQAIEVEDVVIHHKSSTAFLGAGNGYRDYWLPPVQHFNRSIDGNGFIATYNLLNGDVTKLEIVSTTIKSFHPHGIDIFPSKKDDTLIHLFVINHRARSKDTINDLYSVVEIFDYTIGSSKLVHKETIQNELIWTPNDVSAINERDFYVSNDNRFRSGIMRALETYLRLPIAFVAFYDSKSKSMKKVAR